MTKAYEPDEFITWYESSKADALSEYTSEGGNLSIASAIYQTA